MTLTVFTSTTPDDVGRGEEFGRAQKPGIHATWHAYGEVFADHLVPTAVVRRVGEESFEAVEAWAPRLAVEIAAIARGAGLELWQVAALNARSEVLAAAAVTTRGECSTSVFVPEDAPPRTVQTWDWHPAVHGSTVVWQYDRGPGWRVKTFTEFGLLAKIGVNSAGLGLHFNLLQHTSDGATPGVPVHVLARRILDEASTPAEAEDIARSATVSASVALTVVGYDGTRGQACTLEVSPSGVARVPTDEEGMLRRTNHFLDARLAAGERLAVEEPDTLARWSELERRSAELCSDSFETRVKALDLHREDGAALCCHPAEDSPWETHLVIGVDPAGRRLRLLDGSPCTAGDGRWLDV